jgi:hypothetical protein
MTLRSLILVTVFCLTACGGGGSDNQIEASKACKAGPKQDLVATPSDGDQLPPCI